MRERERRETKPEVGERVKGEGLVVNGGGVVETVEEEPGRVVRVECCCCGGREDGGGDYGVPVFTHSGSTDESWDGEEGKDFLC